MQESQKYCIFDDVVKKSFTYVRIPSRIDHDLQELSLTRESDDDHECEETKIAALFGKDSRVKLTLLMRPTSERVPGVYAYSASNEEPNIRATRLAMAFGNLSIRFRGDVLLFRHFRTSILLSDIHSLACVSPDLRESIHLELGGSGRIPPWIKKATQQNYLDEPVLKKFALAMTEKNSVHAQSEEHDIDMAVAVAVAVERSRPSHENGDGSKIVSEPPQFVTKTPLCLECRRPCDFACPDCRGCYFCEPPRTCRITCWSHDCVCATWKVYTARRVYLKEFPFDHWHLQLLTRENELSEDPCRRFLEQYMRLSCDASSWWRTEIDGWAGGKSASAKIVDPSIRWSYKDGFDPILETPPQCRPSADDSALFSCNDVGLIQISSWEDYYRLRNIPLSSPVALLLTFPLTVYHAITMFGSVPVTVARMLNRPIRLHLVGVEKEINFLDIFQEVGYLLPLDLCVEMVFVIRKDMLPPNARKGLERTQLTDNLSICVVSGTYGSDELDPNFDCGSGPPDMVVGLNAGLFAYESWRSVIEYLHVHNGVVGFFTDYNEHSGRHCAALGGASDLYVNPFRQPRAMPVYSMNLPQFSNCFVYVYNEQVLD